MTSHPGTNLVCLVVVGLCASISGCAVSGAASKQQGPPPQACTSDAECTSGDICTGGTCGLCSCTGCEDTATLTGSGATLVTTIAGHFVQGLAVQGDQLVVVAAVDGETAGSDVFTVPVTGGTATSIATGLSAWPQIAGSPGSGGGLQFAVDATNVYLGTKSALVEVPLDGSGPKTLLGQGAYFAIGIASGKLFFDVDPDAETSACEWNGGWIVPGAQSQNEFLCGADLAGMDAQSFYFDAAATGTVNAVPLSVAEQTSPLPAGAITAIGAFVTPTAVQLIDYAAPGAVLYSSYDVSYQAPADFPAASQLIAMISKTGHGGGTLQSGLGADRCGCSGPVWALAGDTGGVYYSTNAGLFFLPYGTCTPTMVSCAIVSNIVVAGGLVYFSVGDPQGDAAVYTVPGQPQVASDGGIPVTSCGSSATNG